MKTKKKWCAFHRRMENISEFQNNSSTKDGMQNVCSVAQNHYIYDYYMRHKEAMNKKSIAYNNFARNKITEEQYVRAIRKINKEHGIKSRI